MKLTLVSGNIIYLSVLGRPIIVINSIEDARELLDKRGVTYSERPPTPLMSDLSVCTFLSEKSYLTIC